MTYIPPYAPSVPDWMRQVSGQTSKFFGKFDTTSGHPFNMFAVSETGQKADLFCQPEDPGEHIGTAYAGLAIEHRVSGSGANGPTSGDYALRISSMKANYPSGSTLGEVGCLDLAVRNDNGDGSCILMNGSQLVGGGFICQTEGVTEEIDPGAGYAALTRIKTQTGVINGASKMGYYALADLGTPANAFLARSAGANVWGSVYTYIKDGNTLFDVSGTGTLTVGTFTANADAPVTGYVTIKTTDGTSRKLAVIA